MHAARKGRSRCIECHGGNAKEPWNPKNPAERVPATLGPRRRRSRARMEQAHVLPTRRDIWTSSANPPSALGSHRSRNRPSSSGSSIPAICASPSRRAAAATTRRTAFVKKSMMTHGGMLWGAALYNNGSYPVQGRAVRRVLPRRRHAGARRSVPGRRRRTRRSVEGILPFLQPLFRWEVSQPGNVLRIFERGGRKPLEIGNPDPEEEPGRPKNRLSNRGLGTLEPHRSGVHRPAEDAAARSDAELHRHQRHRRRLSRVGGCTACHVIYANDRSPVHSGGIRDGRQSGLQPDDRPDDPEERVGPSDQARRSPGRFRPASA